MRLWHEPLVQFLVLGGAVFLAYSFLAPEPDLPREEIVVGPPAIRALEQSFEAAWKRPPTDAERQGLIDDFLVEEVFYREAQKLGLDQDDVVIRRRMRQKLEFLLQEGMSGYKPEDAVLEEYLQANLATYTEADRISFRQIYLGDGADAAAAAPGILARLKAEPGLDPDTLGKRTLLPAGLDAVPTTDADRTFGSGFGAALVALPAEVWSGPVRSGFGLHLVKVERIDKASPPQLEAVRNAVLRDYLHAEERKAMEALVARLKQCYEIIIENPPQ
jgi:hypothetical protein